MKVKMKSNKKRKKITLKDLRKNHKILLKFALSLDHKKKQVKKEF